VDREEFRESVEDFVGVAYGDGEEEGVSAAAYVASSETIAAGFGDLGTLREWEGEEREWSHCSERSWVVKWRERGAVVFGELLMRVIVCRLCVEFVCVFVVVIEESAKLRGDRRPERAQVQGDTWSWRVEVRGMRRRRVSEEGEVMWRVGGAVVEEGGMESFTGTMPRLVRMDDDMKVVEVAVLVERVKSVDGDADEDSMVRCLVGVLNIVEGLGWSEQRKVGGVRGWVGGMRILKKQLQPREGG
jgi:hypothetical protein